ncbi:isoamylase [Pannus brasiliensis CCIBt3594]|uniref:Isoamylase n=1 Tax=Pannus brasiliensis CCIBt3594 TaxID=1427578 RepID=A0AAW9QX39_9CHRO
MKYYQTGYNYPESGDYSPLQLETWSSAKYPLGARYESDRTTFAVYSKNATRILLEIYDRPTGEIAKYDYWMAKNPEDHIWRATIAGVKPGTYYAFRCWGSNWEYDGEWQRGNSNAGFLADVDTFGNRFNPNKVLFDPYAREISHDKETLAMYAAGEDGGMYATGGGEYKGVICREYDTGKWSPKGIVLAPDTTPTGDRPHLPPETSIIYEAHVRGLTRHPSAGRLQTILRGIDGFEAVVNVPEEYRGTYAGAAYMAKYLKALGFTTIELLPVHETGNDNNPDDKPGGNYWGYMTFGYFAPDRRYAYDKSPGGPTREFKRMVKAFHDEGLEVYLDVVYNHTGEGGCCGNNDVTEFVSFGGFDVTEYYQLNDEGYLVDGATGCGNQLNFSKQVTRNLVLDSLTYWLEEMGVDGFRFDLAPVLGRDPDGSDREDWADQKKFFKKHPLLVEIEGLGRSYKAEMIAEAWDIWGYEVGNFPDGWGEWNGRYRDAIRRFLKGDGNTFDFIDRVNGDYRDFNDQGGPARSINFIVAHDGFTLMDLVSYNTKNNLNPWPFGPSDGGNDSNDSWDSGGNHGLRRQRLRNFWTVQFFSRGIPMTVWGDEFGRTQNGNNNPYNIDSVATWNHYDSIATRSPHQVDTGYPIAYHDNFGTATNFDDRNPLFIFAAYLARLRRGSQALKQRVYGDTTLESPNNVTYLFKKTDGKGNLVRGDRCIRLLIDGSAVGDRDFLLLINMYHLPVKFSLPIEGKWARIIDTAGWAEPEYNCWSIETAARLSGEYEVNGFSIVVFEEIDD